MMAATSKSHKICTLNVNGIQVTGMGVTEEEARENVLKQVNEMVNISPVPPGGCILNPTITAQQGARRLVSQNMVGKLQELCVAKHWPLPVYTIEKMQGPSHLPHFSMKCRVLSLTAVGSGSSKKEAKHNAAKNILDVILGRRDQDGDQTSESTDIRLPICPPPTVERKETPECGPLKLEIIPLANVERTVTPEHTPPILSYNMKPAIDCSANSCDQSTAHDFIIMDKEERKKIMSSIEKHSVKIDEISESKEAIALPSVEDYLCWRLQNLNSNNEK